MTNGERMTEAMRAKFEAWAGPADYELSRESDGRYRHLSTGHAYDAWQAATAARDEEWRVALEKIYNEPDHPTDQLRALRRLLSTGPRAEGGG